MKVFATIFVQRDAQVFNPRVRFEARGLFARAETQLRGNATTTQDIT